jgi:hypothetical protein
MFRSIKTFVLLGCIAGCGVVPNVSLQYLQAEEYVLTHDLVAKAEPGVVIDDKAPGDWTDLVIKSCPRATKGDLSSMSRTDKSLSSAFRTVTLAKVEERVIDGQRAFQLSRVGLGLCVPVENKGDVLVTPDTCNELGADLGFLGRTVLGKIYSEFEKVHYVCRSDTAAIYDSPVVMRYKEKNREMVIRYAMVVNQENGRLDTMAWLIETDGNNKYKQLVGSVQWLPNNLVTHCDLYVDANEYTFGIPSSRAFAVVATPQGRVRFRTPEHLKEVCLKAEYNQEDAELMVSSLRKIVNYYDKKSAAAPNRDSESR